MAGRYFPKLKIRVTSSLIAREFLMIQIRYFEDCSFERHHFEAELRATDVALKKKHTRSGHFERN
jgi:hypothetical protein